MKPHDLWRSILVNGGHACPTDEVLSELHRYCGMPINEIKELAEQSPSMTGDVWNRKDRSTSVGLQHFYDNVSHWVFGTLAYHARQAEGEIYPLPVLVADYLEDFAPGTFLDFGCGVATASLLFDKLGWEVTAADISGPLLDFARWRMNDRGANIKICDLRRARLPDDEYDVICAFNTIGHVPNALDTISDLRRALRSNGFLFFDIDTRTKEENIPWHLYQQDGEIVRSVRKLGFHKATMLGPMHVFRKTEMAPLQRSFVGAYDMLRYNQTALQLEKLATRAKRRLARVSSPREL